VWRGRGGAELVPPGVGGEERGDVALSRAVTKLGLALVTVAGPIVAIYPKLALLLADVGDWLSAVGVKLACYGG